MMVINIYTGREVAGSILDSSMRFSCDPVLQTRRTWGGRRCGAARSEDDAQAVCRRHPSRPGTASTFAVSNMHIPVSVGSLRGWVLAVCNYAFIVVHRGTKFGLGLVSWTKPAAEGSGPPSGALLEILPPRPTPPHCWTSQACFCLHRKQQHATLRTVENHGGMRHGWDQ